MTSRKKSPSPNPDSTRVLDSDPWDFISVALARHGLDLEPRKWGEFTIEEFREKFKLSERKGQTAIAKLVDAGDVTEREGIKENGRRCKFYKAVKQ